MALRDGQALLQTLDELGRNVRRDGRGFAARLRRDLRHGQRDEHRRLRRQVLRRSAALLQPIRERAATLPPSGLNAARPVEGLKRAYKKAREAGERAHEERTDDRLHEWRKQTKYLDNQLDILMPWRPRRFAKSRKRAHKLADRLGDDHDLAMLEQRIGEIAGPHAAQADGAGALLTRLRRRRRKLQRRAFRLGRRLYVENPKRYQP
jgi:CHAD domain-containing protein